MSRQKFCLDLNFVPMKDNRRTLKLNYFVSFIIEIKIKYNLEHNPNFVIINITNILIFIHLISASGYINF